MSCVIRFKWFSNLDVIQSYSFWRMQIRAIFTCHRHVGGVSTRSQLERAEPPGRRPVTSSPRPSPIRPLIQGKHDPRVMFALLVPRRVPLIFDAYRWFDNLF